MDARDIHYILGLYRDNGKENGNYYSILELYWDNGNKMETTIVRKASCPQLLRDSQQQSIAAANPPSF